MNLIAFQAGRLVRMFFDWLRTRSLFQWGVIGIIVLCFFILPKWLAILVAGGSWKFLGLRLKEGIAWAAVFVSLLAGSVFLAILVALISIWLLYVRGSSYQPEEEDGPDILGNARWAKFKDYRHSLLSTKLYTQENTEPVGMVALGRVIFPPVKKNQPWEQDFIVSDKEGHILTVAQTGSGKGVNVVIPNVLLYDHSLVVLDPKGENFIKTHHFRITRKQQEICLIDPFREVSKELQAKIEEIEGMNYSPEGEAMAAFFHDVQKKSSTYGQYLKGFNPLQVIEDLLEKEDYDQILDEANVIADMIVVKTPQDKDPHWNEKARSFIRGMILYVTFFDQFRQDRQTYPLNLVTVKDQLEEVFSSKPKMDAFIGRCQLNPYLKSVAATVSMVAEQERASVLSTVQRQMDFLNSKNVQESLTRNDFQLDDIRKHEKSIYLVLPANKIQSYGSLARLWIASIKSSLERINDGLRAKRPVLFMLDEVAQLGRMQPLVNAISLSRSYGLKLWMIFQDVAQMKSAYPDDEWRTFFSNTKAQQFFGVSPTDVDTCEFISKAAGQTTVQFQTTSVSESENRGSSSNWGSSSGGGGQSSWSSGSQSNRGYSQSVSINQQIQARPLVLPNEVPQKTKDKILIFGADISKFPILAEQMPYHEIDMFDNRYPVALENGIQQKLLL